MKRIHRFSLSLIALSSWLAVQALAETPTAERVLPDDTLVMVTVPSCSKLREVSAQSPMGQLWNDPAMKPFKDKFMTKLKEDLVQPLEQELGVKLEDYAGLAQGQFTLAITANGWKGEKGTEPAMVLLLDSGEKRAELEKALSEFRKKWTDAGKTIRTEQVRGLEFLAVGLSTNDIPDTLKRLLPGPSDVRELGDEADASEAEPSDAGATDKKTELFFGRAESVLVVGDNLRALERVVSRLTGGSSPVLADVPQFQSCQPVFFREAQVFGWANAQTLIGALTKVSVREEAASEEAPDPFAQVRPEKILKAAGLNGLRSAAFALQDSPDGALIQFHIGVPEADRKGVLRILAGESKETTPPAFVPADVLKFTRWRVDGQKAWTTLTAALNDISPTIMSVADYFISTANEAGKMKDENFDLRRQMIGNIGDDIISFEKKPRDAESAEDAPSLLLIGSKAPEEMAAAMKVLFGALSRSGNAEEREFLGRKIYSVSTMAGPQLDPTRVQHRKMHLSYTGSYVLIANDEAVLEEYLRSAEPTGKPLSEMPGLLAAAQRVSGPGTSLLIYENQRETQRAKYEQLKKLYADQTDSAPPEESGMTPLPESFGVAMPQQSILGWFDYSLLPPFEAVAKYYSFVVIGGSADVDGLTWKVFSPVPAELKN